MVKILLLEQQVLLGDDLKFLFEGEGHSVDWLSDPEKIQAAYNNVPNYDFAFVDRNCNERMPGPNNDEMIQKLKQTYPNKKVFCLTHSQDSCKYADKNIPYLTEAVIIDLMKEIANSNI